MLLILAGGWITDRIRLVGHLEAERERRAQADTLATERLQRALRADSLRSVAVGRRVDLEAALLASEGERARMAGLYREAAADVTFLTQTLAEARSSLTAMANRMEVDSLTGVATASGTFDDGLLSAAWSCTIPPGELRLRDYTARVPLEVIGATGPDGRHLVTVASPDPRVRASAAEYFVDPPPPVVDHSIRFRDRTRISGQAIAGWELVKLLVRQLRGG